MILATAYIISASRSYPIMQLDFKENVQNMTNGQVYVKLAPGGQLGAGGALAQKVQQGTILVAQHFLVPENQNRILFQRFNDPHPI